MKIILSVLAFIAVLSTGIQPGGGQIFRWSPAEAAGWNISTWTPSTNEWREKLGINYGRSGWTGPPDKGLETVKQRIARDHLKKFFLSIYSPKADPMAEDLRKNALLYSQLSRDVKELEAIGMDDFLDKYRHLSRIFPNPASVLNEVIDNTKKINPNLKFGITLYVKDLDNKFVSDAKFPPFVRNKIDYVHLYISNRMDGPNYASYVTRTKSMFPNAKIIAGAYAFDRIDYSTAYRNDPSKRRCTPEQEIRLFEQALEIQARLLREGQVEAIEFYPGYFGMEEKTIAKHGKCALNRRSECLQNTQQMSAAALRILNKYKP